MEEREDLTEEMVVEIEVERLRAFEDHPFKVRADSQMFKLQESVRKYGILHPLIVRSRIDGTMRLFQDTEESLRRKSWL